MKYLRKNALKIPGNVEMWKIVTFINKIIVNFMTASHLKKLRKGVFFNHLTSLLLSKVFILFDQANPIDIINLLQERPGPVQPIVNVFLRVLSMGGNQSIWRTCNLFTKNSNPGPSCL